VDPDVLRLHPRAEPAPNFDVARAAWRSVSRSRL